MRNLKFHGLLLCSIISKAIVQPTFDKSPMCLISDNVTIGTARPDGVFKLNVYYKNIFFLLSNKRKQNTDDYEITWRRWLGHIPKYGREINERSYFETFGFHGSQNLYCLSQVKRGNTFWKNARKCLGTFDLVHKMFVGLSSIFNKPKVFHEICQSLLNVYISLPNRQ